MGKIYDRIDDTVADFIHRQHQRRKNAQSIDGLPGLVLPPREG